MSTMDESSFFLRRRRIHQGDGRKSIWVAESKSGVTAHCIGTARFYAVAALVDWSGFQRAKCRQWQDRGLPRNAWLASVHSRCNGAASHTWYTVCGDADSCFMVLSRCPLFCSVVQLKPAQSARHRLSNSPRERDSFLAS